MATETATPTYARRLAAEALGTAILLMAIVGPGILAMKTSGGNVAMGVMAVAAAVFAVLAGLIAMFAPISGAHFNPAVTLMVAALGDLKWKEAPGYVLAQLVGGSVGVVLTNLMFELPAVTLSTTARTGGGQWLGEFIATFGLFATIWGIARIRPNALPFAVAGYVFGAVWFTSSTCFANPAVTFARALTDTLTGIRPADVPAFVVFQLLGAGAATAFFQWLVPPPMAAFLESVVPEAQATPTEPVTRPRAASGPLAPLN
jgi:glycerol uptake facilitator-like aquaporin